MMSWFNPDDDAPLSIREWIACFVITILIVAAWAGILWLCARLANWAYGLL